MNNEKFLQIFFIFHKNEFTYSIQMLAKDEDDYVREMIAQHPNLNDELIHKLVKDRSYFVRMAIAKRQNLSNELIQILFCSGFNCKTCKP